MSEEIKHAAEKIKKQSARPTASTILADGSLVEMVYRPEENRTLFCISKESSIRYEPSLLAGGQRLVPYSPGNNLLRNEVVLFPRKPPNTNPSKSWSGKFSASFIVMWMSRHCLSRSRATTSFSPGSMMPSTSCHISVCAATPARGRLDSL